MQLRRQTVETSPYATSRTETEHTHGCCKAREREADYFPLMLKKHIVYISQIQTRRGRQGMRVHYVDEASVQCASLFTATKQRARLLNARHSGCLRALELFRHSVVSVWKLRRHFYLSSRRSRWKTCFVPDSPRYDNERSGKVRYCRPTMPLAHRAVLEILTKPREYGRPRAPSRLRSGVPSRR